MIQYALKCAEGHRFDSWFQSASAYDKLQAAGLVCCAHCGSSKVEKVLMAPAVRPARNAQDRAAEQAERADAGAQTAGQTSDKPTKLPEPVPQGTASLATPSSEVEAMLQEMRRQVEATSEYVGSSFAKEARAMHLGETEEKSIYGEAKPEEAKALFEEGIPVLPLPFLPKKRSN